jgi:hypothetical protein
MEMWSNTLFILTSYVLFQWLSHQIF